LVAEVAEPPTEQAMATTMPSMRVLIDSLKLTVPNEVLMAQIGGRLGDIWA
jgi:hypothetical protein